MHPLHIKFHLLERKLNKALAQGEIQMALLDDLTVKVAALEASATNAIALLDALKAAQGNPAEAAALAARVDTVNQSIDAAVTRDAV